MVRGKHLGCLRVDYGDLGEFLFSACAGQAAHRWAEGPLSRRMRTSLRKLLAVSLESVRDKDEGG